MKQTPTAWFCVATAGPTVDGREIKEQWLTEAAETYNAAEYTAMIWPSSVDRHQNGTTSALFIVLSAKRLTAKLSYMRVSCLING